MSKVIDSVTTSTSSASLALGPMDVPAPVTTGTQIPPNISIDELIEWITTQLQASDTHLRSEMAGVSATNDQVAAIDHLETIFNQARKDDGGNTRVPTDIYDGSYKSEGWYQSLPQDQQKALDAFVANDVGTNTTCPATGPFMRNECGKKETLDMTADQVVANGLGKKNADGTVTVYGDGSASLDSVDAFVKGCGTAADSLQSDSQTQMIQLQSDVSARARLVEMVSDMIKSWNDSATATIQNFK